MERLGIILFLIGILGFLIMIIVGAFQISVACGLFIFFIILAFVGSIMGGFFTEVENVEDDWEED